MIAPKRGDVNKKIVNLRGIFGAESLPLGGKVARYAPDEGDTSGSCPLISHLR